MFMIRNMGSLDLLIQLELFLDVIFARLMLDTCVPFDDTFFRIKQNLGGLRDLSLFLHTSCFSMVSMFVCFG